MEDPAPASEPEPEPEEDDGERLRVEGATALAWRRGRYAALPGLKGRRIAPIVFGGACLHQEALISRVTTEEFNARARLYSLDDAYVVMGLGDDGAVVTRDRELVLESAMFSQVQAKARPVELAQPLRREGLGEVVVGVDAGSHNYFHWLLYALARARLCADQIPGAEIVLPDSRLMREEPGRLRPSVMESSRAAMLGGRPVRQLRPGVYRARRVHMLWTRPAEPTDLSCLAGLYPIFDEVVGQLAPHAGPPRRRLYLSRREANDKRLPAADILALETLLARYDFETLDLGEMSFEAQVRAAATAEIIVSPHGAGLTNLLFSPREAMVIELIGRMGEEPTFRPWFYQLCSGRGQRYTAIHVKEAGWLDDLRTAIRRSLNLRRR